MNGICPVCFKPLPRGPAGRALIAVGSRPVITVHQGDCKEAALAGVRVLGKGLLYGARQLLHRRFPVASALIEDYAALRRAQREKERLHG